MDKSCSKLKYLATLFLCFFTAVTVAQTFSVQGMVKKSDGTPVADASIFVKSASQLVTTDKAGKYILRKLPKGELSIVCFSEGNQVEERKVILVDKDLVLDFTLSELKGSLEEIQVQAEKDYGIISHMQAIDNFGFYEAKKNELIELSALTINTSTNNSRQLYSRVAGLNIWESDQAGVQLGIGGRGLNPNRTSNFNTRQNGYDISADALGYPESYYTPPAEALDKIEIIRGASSLQYGTQFGGMINFRFKKGPEDKPFEFTTRQTLGSWNYFGSFNSIGGTVNKGKLNYYAYYNFKKGDGYRENSDFKFQNAYASVSYEFTDKFEVVADFTKMHYLAHQPGGLTDKMFEQDPRQSVRARNWFVVDWNIVSLNATYKFSPKTQINTRNFMLVADRQALGNLERINVADLGGNRTLINGEFKNFGNETRLIHRYEIANKNSALLVGWRIYHGTTQSDQGDGSDGSDADFSFLNSNDLENSSYTFPNKNYSLFAENIFDLNSKLSITPGLRLENIQTFSDGFYKQYVYDGAGNIVVENRFEENQERKRTFLIGGLGISYKFSETSELYGNISQNYRAINFSDLRIVNPNMIVDPDIQDEKGYTADLGWRGSVNNVLSYDLTGYYLAYKDKIGQILKADQPPLYLDYRYRGNISDARTFGLEALVQLNLTEVLAIKPKWLVYVNTSLTNSRYINSEDKSIEGNEVEMVPPAILRAGSEFGWDSFSVALQYAYTARHYTDATNAVLTSTAIEGIIPSYQVVDLSAKYHWKQLSFEASCNNLLNESYFSRRADSYPGPGIIPADGRGVYVTLNATF